MGQLSGGSLEVRFHAWPKVYIGTSAELLEVLVPQDDFEIHIQEASRVIT